MIDLRGRRDVPVAEPVLAELASALGDLDIPFLVIGAAARDLAIHARQGATAVRATLDLDIAVAVDSSAEFEAIGARLPRSPHVPHRFDVLGTEVDVVPFGPVESGRSICFANDHRLDVTGLAEAAATSLPVLLPGGALVRVASPAAQTALKVLAWRDRGHGHSKDALDLFTILAAMSEHPFDDEVWADTRALEATDHDIRLAACYRTGVLAAAPFAVDAGRTMLEVPDDPEARDRLVLHIRDQEAASLLEAYRRGFHKGLGT